MEILCMKKLNQYDIASLFYEVYEEKDRVILVEEYIEGIELSCVMGGSNVYTEGQAREIMRALLEGI